MPPSMDQIRQQDLYRSPIPTRLTTDIPPPVPLNPVATGQQGIIRVQWAVTNDVDGYDIAIMTSANLANPDVNIARAPGANNREFVYPVGNSATTRYFAIRSFVGNVYSNWSAIVSATSVVFGGVEAAPPSPPVTPPSGFQPLPIGSGSTGGGGNRLPK